MSEPASSALIAFIAILLVPGIIYAASKFAAKIAIGVIPILCAIIIYSISSSVGEDPSLIDRAMIGVFSSFVILLGMVGVYGSLLHAELHDLSKGLEEISNSLSDE